MSHKGKTTAYSQFLKREAHALGFSYIGISKAEKLVDEEKHLSDWLNKGYHGKMSYMENHFELRLDPTKLVPGTKSVITLLYNYHNPNTQTDPTAPKISQYAYGQDYHHIIKRKLRTLHNSLKEEIGNIGGRAFVDSAPILERSWAEKAGLGWVGKHSLLINKDQGSYFFIAVLALDIELEYDGPIKDYCGTCTKCIDACPTDAIVDNKVVDGSKCISYLTIELKDEIPSEFKGKMENWMFGCDICQQVCPWNRFAKPHSSELLHPHPNLLDMTREEWQEVTEDVFRDVFKKSAVKRTKYIGLRRNIDFLKE